MTQEEQSPQQIGIQSNSGGDINIEQSQVNIAGRDMHIHASRSAQEKDDSKNRKTLLKLVRTTWITGYLEQLRPDSDRIELGLKPLPEAVINPWQQTVQEMHVARKFLPPGTSIIEVYVLAACKLLILGLPGSGKTILLLELARDLLDRAEQDKDHQIPVVLTLSSWTVKRQPLADWLVDELDSKYEVKPRIGRRWINNNLILPLLDGLDEVSEENRGACINAINAYQQEHSQVPLVVCSRSADYFAASTRLQLRGALEIEPLTLQQIDSYLSGVGIEVVRNRVYTDPEFQELVTSPLILRIAREIYVGQSQDLAGKAGRLTLHQIFADYIEQMFHRRHNTSPYTQQQTLHWLNWLAKQMLQHHQAVFYLEEIQPSWLPEEHLRQHSYRRWVQVGTALLCGLIGGLAGGLAGELIITLFFGPASELLFGLLFGGLFAGIVGGILIGGTHHIELEIQRAEILRWSWRNMWQSLRASTFLKSGLVGGIGVGLLFAVIVGLIALLANGVSGVLSGLASGLLVGLLFCPISGATSESVERILKNQRARGYATRNGCLVGLASGLVSGLIFGVLGVLCGVGVGLLEEQGKGLLLWLIIGAGAGIVFGGVAIFINGLVVWLTYSREKERTAEVERNTANSFFTLCLQIISRFGQMVTRF